MCVGCKRVGGGGVRWQGGMVPCRPTEKKAPVAVESEWSMRGQWVGKWGCSSQSHPRFSWEWAESVETCNARFSANTADTTTARQTAAAPKHPSRSCIFQTQKGTQRALMHVYVMYVLCVGVGFVF